MIPPLSLEAAQARLLDGCDPLPQEIVQVADAAFRRLAAPLSAQRTQPWADLSAMDGFATAGRGPWRVVGESAAGHPHRCSIAAGEAVRISTGAALPPGTDAVLLIEDAQLDADMVAASGTLPSERHIRRRGFDFAEGDTLLPAGVLLGPAQLALAIASGAPSVGVQRVPNLAIIDSGDELSRGPSDRRSDAIPASNGPMIAAQCAGLAQSVMRLGPVRDDADALRAAFDAAHAADVIVTTGGASVGAHDLVRPALAEWGADIDFWRVAIRPGKPLLVGRRGKQTVVGLPGNPASAFVTAHFFVLPLLRHLAGAPRDQALPTAKPALLDGGLPPGGRRREFMRGVIEGGVVRPLAERDSSAIRTLSAANCLIDRAAGAPPLETGAQIMVHMLGG